MPVARLGLAIVAGIQVLTLSPQAGTWSGGKGWVALSDRDEKNLVIFID
jgi:hypothetical protein